MHRGIMSVGKLYVEKGNPPTLIAPNDMHRYGPCRLRHPCTHRGTTLTHAPFPRVMAVCGPVLTNLLTSKVHPRQSVVILSRTACIIRT